MGKRVKPWRGGERGEWVAGYGERARARQGKAGDAHIVFDGGKETPEETRETS